MIVVIDYGLGNLASVENTLTKLSFPAVISCDPETMRRASALILPGVGAAGEGMKNLQQSGLDIVIKEEIAKGKPFLGICLGMQLLFEKSEEGNVDCLGILKGGVRKFQKKGKVPQIGWNNVKLKMKNGKLKIAEGIPDESYFYFVNSYYCIPIDTSIVVGESEYGEVFPSIIATRNIVATQFHPEKSGEVGMQLLKNFTEGGL